jgi:anti-sigma B factor antagonist
MAAGSSFRPFEVVKEQQSETTFVRLYGEVDLASEKRFQELTESIPREGLRRVVLDLRGVTFIDSIGLRSIIDLWKRSRDDGFELAIVRGGPSIRHLFELVGLDGVLPAVDGPSPLPDAAMPAQ